MWRKQTYSTKQLRDYSNLFLRSEVQAWLSEDLSSIRNSIERYESKLPYYEQYDQSVGLISFNSKKRQHFTQHREAHYSIIIDAGVIMHILHTQEYKALVLSYYGYLPEMTSFNQFNICMDLIKRIPLKELNRLFIKQMKSRARKQVLSSRYYREFNQLSLALSLSRAEKNRLIQVLKSPLNA